MSELIDRIFDVERITKDKEAIEALLNSLTVNIKNYKDTVDSIAGSVRKSKSTDDLAKKADELNKVYSDGKKTVDLYVETQKQLENQEKLLLQTKAKLATANTDNAKDIDVNKKALKEQNDLLKAENILNDKNAGTLEKAAAANLKLSIEKKKLNLATEEGKKRLQEINDEQDKNNKLIASSGNELEKQKINIGNYKSAFSGLFSSFKSGEIGVGGLTNGVMALGKQMMIAIVTNPILLTIGAIVGAFMLLKNALVRSEEGQDRLNKVTAIFSAMLDAVMDIIHDVSIFLFDAFSKPQESIKALGALIKDNIINRFEAIGKILPLIGELFEDLKNRDFTKLKKDAIELGRAYGTILTGLDKEQQDAVFNGLVKIGDKIIENAGKGEYAAKLQAQYNKLERKYIVENAKLASDSAKKRADAELLKKTNAKAALLLLDQAADADEKIAANELKLAKLRKELAIKNSDIAIDNIADKKAIAQAEAEVFEKQTAYDEKRRERLRNANKIGKEALAQQLENNRYIIEAMRGEAEASIKKNEIIASDEKKTLTERLEAAKANNLTRLSLINEEYSIDKKTLDDNLALKFISEEDYAKAVEELKKKHDSSLLLEETTIQQEIIAIKDNALKVQIELFQKELKNEAELLQQNYKTKENELKKQYSDGEINKKEYEEKLAKLQLDSQTEVNSKSIELLKKQLSVNELSVDKRAELSKQLADLEIQNETLKLDAVIDANEKKTESDKKRSDKAIQIATDLTNATFDLFSSIAEFQTQKSEQRMSELEKELEASNTTFDEQQTRLDGAIMSDESRADKKIEIENQRAAAEKVIQAKIMAEKVKQAKWEKAQSIIQAVISTAQAVIGAMAMVPFTPANIAFAALAATTGAVNIATIAAQPLPAYEHGGVTGQGLVLWGERRAEVAVSPSGDTFIADSPTVSNFEAGTRIYKSVAEYENFMSRQSGEKFSFDYDKFDKMMPRLDVKIDARGLLAVKDKQGNRRKAINRTCTR